MEGAMKALVDAFETKFKEAVKVQEDHTRKMAKENQLLRAKLTTLIKKARPSFASSESNPIPSHVEGDSIWVGDLDLMTLVPDSGPSSFGRTVAAAAFGEGDKCKPINERIGPKLSKKGARTPCDADLEQKFRDCIARNFSNDIQAATEKAISGANQYGLEMRRRFPTKILKRDAENIPPTVNDLNN